MQTGDADGIGTIDPGFDSFIEKEIASLSNSVGVVLTGMSAQLCNGVLAFGNGGAAPESLPLPVVRSGAGCGGQLTLTAEMPSANEIEVDADGSEGTNPYDAHDPAAMSLFTASATLTVTLTSPATLQLDLNTAWATSAPVVTLGQNTYTLGAFVLVANPRAGIFFDVHYDYSLQQGSSGSTSIQVPAGTYVVILALGSRNQAANAGSGWLARLTVR